MDPVSTGVGLAASLITICAVFLNSCLLLSSLKHKMEDAPDDVRFMCQLAEDCSVLLADFSTADCNFRYTDPKVQHLWQHRKDSMSSNIREFESLVTCLQNSLSRTTSGFSIRSRIRVLLSEQKVARFNRLLEENKSFIILLNSIEVRYQLDAIRKCQEGACSILTSIGKEESTYRITLGNQMEDMSAKIEKLSRPMVLKANSTQEANKNERVRHSVNFGTEILSQGPRHATKIPDAKVSKRHIKMITPFGTFSVTRFIEMDVFDDSETAPRKYDTFYCFVPENWITTRTVQIRHTMELDASRIPFWQRIEFGSISSVPSGLTEALHHNDLWSAGHIVQRMGFRSLTQLSLIWNDQKKPNSVWSNFNNWTLERHGNQFTIRLRHIPEGVSVGTLVIGPREQLVSGSSCHSHSESNMQICILGGTSWTSETLARCSKRLFVLTTDISLFKETDAPPALCIDPSESGLQTYRRHIMRSLEYTSIDELHVLDRWWLSALNFSNPRFAWEMALSRGTAVECCTMQDYIDTVQEVLDSPSKYHRQVFLTWLCSMGTPKMLRPFIQSGYNFDEEYQGPEIPTLQISRSYAQIAGTFRNIPVLRLLAQNGFGLHPTALGICMPSSVEHTEHLELLQSLIENVSQKFLPVDDTVAYGPVLRFCQSASVLRFPDFAIQAPKRLCLSGLGCYTQPPFARTHYLGPELILAVFVPIIGDVVQTLEILLDLGASPDYQGPPGAEVPGTALDWAVDLGYPRQISCLIQRTASFADYRKSILHALERSTRNLEAIHPRPCPFNQRCRFSSWSLEGPLTSFKFVHQVGGVTLEVDKKCVEVLRDAVSAFHVDGPEFSRALDRASSKIAQIEGNERSRSYNFFMHRVGIWKRWMPDFLSIGEPVQQAIEQSWSDYLFLVICGIVCSGAIALNALLYFIIWVFHVLGRALYIKIGVLFLLSAPIIFSWLIFYK